MNRSNDVVRMWEESVEIPTYGVGKPDPNPMFLEKRVYQGSSGKVYPYPVIDKIEDEKHLVAYRMVFLENEYVQIQIMPELGGRIYRAIDKTNNYDFVYYNQVIKPALVGLAGPWISGGIELNWPQHHRPNTFGPVEYKLSDNEDGSKTVWISEIDRMYGTKGMAGYTLYPGKAYLEIKGQLYNRTSLPQTFLWWANPAVAAHDETESVFPPDIHAVSDHGKRDVSRFPIATGTYYKMDYSEGVDISRYKNIPVPTSYMAYHSEYNFVGGYDHREQAGILHVANHHISPGKKQWTWGNGEFGRAWDRNLTDEDGPYIELMTGVYTDNQPDFTWIQPYEEKTFQQYFLPYKQVGVVKNATIDAAINLEVKEERANIAVYTTSLYEDAVVELIIPSGRLWSKTITLSPVEVLVDHIMLKDGIQPHELTLRVLTKDGKLLVDYQPTQPQIEELPEAAIAILEPQKLANTEALLLAGQHLEQYRHATYEPELYYREGLVRDPDDSRLNNAYGSLLLRRGKYAESESYLRRAVATITRHNPNPYDSEPYYNLGLALKNQGKLKEAYDAFYKATWSSAWQDKGYFAVAQIDCEWGDYATGLEHIEQALMRNYRSIRMRDLKTAMLRKVERLKEAEEHALGTLRMDVTDFVNRNELSLIYEAMGSVEEAKQAEREWLELVQGAAHNYISVSEEYCDAGLYTEASVWMDKVINNGTRHPMASYTLAYSLFADGHRERAAEVRQQAAAQARDYCFPTTLFEQHVLEQAVQLQPEDSSASYYLGLLYYDKKRYEEAISLWESSAEQDSSFPTVYRNLALAYFNKRGSADQARLAMERAFHLTESDARILFELDQLYKKLGVPAQERLQVLERHISLVHKRDDLFIEYVALINDQERYEEAMGLIAGRNFHPWEGGEGKVPSQYQLCHVEIAKLQLAEGQASQAVDTLHAALVYPEHIGEGKLAGAQENNIYYYLGCAWEQLADKDRANAAFNRAAIGQDEPASAMFYNDQPPEMIFYQGLACRKLGNEKQARSRFNKLVGYGEKHVFKSLKLDYFAVSLPDFLVFEEDLDRKNEVHCRFMMALGYLGLGARDQATEQFNRVLKLEPAHQGSKLHLRLVLTGEL